MGEDLALRARLLPTVAAWTRRARVRSTSVAASSSGVRELERRRRLQRSSSRCCGSPRSSWRSWSGAVTITLRSCTSACRRTSTALRRASSSSRSASRRCPARGSASVLAREHRAGGPDRVEPVVLALQPPLVARAAAGLEHRLAAAAQIDGRARHRSGPLPRPPRHAGRRRARPRTASACAYPRAFAATDRCATTAPVGATTTASTCSSRCVSTPTT